MYESFKNNIFLKSILVLVIGAFIFNLFFGFITGRGDYYSFRGLINEMLVLLIKLLVVLFLIIVIAVLTKWLREIYIENTNTDIFRRISNDPIVKSMIIIAIVVTGSIFLFGLLNGFMVTTANNMNANMGATVVGQYNGNNFGLYIASLMSLLIKILISILIFTLIFGSFMYLKEQYEKENMKSQSNINNNNNNANNDILSKNNKEN